MIVKFLLLRASRNYSITQNEIVYCSIGALLLLILGFFSIRAYKSRIIKSNNNKLLIKSEGKNDILNKINEYRQANDTLLEYNTQENWSRYFTAKNKLLSECIKVRNLTPEELVQFLSILEEHEKLFIEKIEEIFKGNKNDIEANIRKYCKFCQLQKELLKDNLYIYAIVHPEHREILERLFLHS